MCNSMASHTKGGVPAYPGHARSKYTGTSIDRENKTSRERPPLRPYKCPFFKKKPFLEMALDGTYWKTEFRK